MPHQLSSLRLQLRAVQQQLPQVRKLTEAYKRFRRARTRLLRLQRELLTLIDRLEAARVEQGEQQFATLVAYSSPPPRCRK